MLNKSLTTKGGLLLCCLFLFQIALKSQNLTTVSPDKGQIGQKLSVFIAGSNVNFSQGSTSIQTTFKQGNFSINAPFKDINQSGNELEVSLDLSDTAIISGKYDIEVNTPAHGVLTKLSAFTVDSTSLRKTIPNNVFKYDSSNVLIIGRILDFSQVVINPYFFRGTDTIYTNIVTPRLRGTDSLEVRINLNDSSLTGGYYDLAVNTPGGELYLRNALKVNTNDIFGHVFIDKNINGILDSGEYGVSQFAFELIGMSVKTYSNSTGDFSFLDLDTGRHEIAIINRDGSYVTGSSDTLTVNIDTVGYYSVSIGVNTTNKNKIHVYSSSGRARCNESVTYRNFIRNLAFDSINVKGVYVFIKDSILTYDTTAVNLADSVKGDSLFLSFNDISSLRWTFLGNTKCLLPSISVLPIGSILETKTFAYLTDSSNNRITGSDTSYFNSTIVRCSYDPNDKQVSPVGMDSLGFIAKETKLTYTIRFQNTGNDTAYRVVLVDSLSGNLDLNSINILDASHSYRSQLSSNGILEFTFENIFLVDSATNEAESNGFITFDISPKRNLIDSTMVTNRAAIYFDFNPPIITNTVVTTYITITSIEEIVQGIDAAMYPNPSQGLLNIKVKEKLHEGILTIYDLTGKRLYRQSGLNTSKFTVELNAFTNGFYLIEIQSGNKRYTNKLLLQRGN